MNLFEEWCKQFNEISPFGKIAFWRKSISEERSRYSNSPYECVRENWRGWFYNMDRSKVEE
jgi:hypothetical protein